MQESIKNCVFLDESRQNLLKKYMPTSGDLKKLSAFFSAFSDCTRMKIISALSVSSMCVGDLGKITDLNQTTLSHQLATLKRLDIVEDERRGKVVFYKIKNARVLQILYGAVEILD